MSQVAAVTSGAVSFFFMLFIMLYSMYFFLKGGPKILNQILYYMPLSSVDERRLLDKFVSVTRATVKGSIVVGIVQGALAGASFALAGISGSMLWATMMAVFSVLPGIGSAIVWIPAVVYLLITNQIVAAIAVGLWCAIVVGSIDNFLRPRLVGRDTEMPDLLILLGTLGGVVLFGFVGVIIGPIVTALFLTIWELYGTAFRAYLIDDESTKDDSPEASTSAPEDVASETASAEA